MKVTIRVSWQRKEVFQAMYRWSLPIMMLLGLAIFGIYYLLGHTDRMLAEPLIYVADILVRSLVVPLVVIPSLIVYYRGQSGEKGYFADWDEGYPDDEDVDTVIFFVLFFVVAILSGLICWGVGDLDTIIYIGPIVFFGVMGFICSFIDRLGPALTVSGIVFCFFYLLIGSCSTILTCIYFTAAGLASYHLTEWFTQFCKDFRGFSSANSLGRKAKGYFLPKLSK